MTRPSTFGGYGETRHWKVIHDPSNAFTGNLFRLIDIQAGGFDIGTTFEHVCTGKRRTVSVATAIRKGKGNAPRSSTKHSKRPAYLPSYTTREKSHV